MISPFNPRARRAICRPVQFVSGETGSLAGFRMRLSTPRENLPVVIRCQYQSATDSLPGCGQDRDGFPSLRLGRLFAGLTPRLLPRMMRPKPQCALLGSPMSRHTRDTTGFLNFWRALRAWSFGILAQPAKQSRSRFTKSLKSFSSARFHARNKAWRRTHDVQRNTASGA